MKPIKEIIQEAYKLYMPQIESEITSLAEFLRKEIEKKPDFTIVEIGTKFGGTFKIWCELNPEGKKVSIDIPAGMHGGISEEEFNRRNARFVMEYRNVHFLTGNSHHETTRRRLIQTLGVPMPIKHPDELRCIDFLFIDGDHTYQGVKDDFEMYSPLVRENGWIAFHDINDSEYHRSRNVFVEKFWNEVKDGYPNWEFNVGDNWAGVGLIQIP